MTSTRAAILVARREFVQRARSKAFLISNAFIFLAVIAGIAVPAFVGDDDDTWLLGHDPDAAEVAALAVDMAPQFGAEIDLESVADETTAAQRLDPDLVVEGEQALDAVLRADGSVLVDDELAIQLEQVLTAARRQAGVAEILAEADLTDEQRQTLATSPDLRVESLDPGQEVTQGPALAVGAFAVFALYGLLIFYGQFVAQGIVEEKSSRVIEILLSAVHPTALLYGKILGLAALGILQTLLFAAMGVGAATVLLDLVVPTEAYATLVLAIVWYLLGFTMYAAIFAVAGTLVSRQEDLQSTIFPAMVPIVAGFFIAQASLQNPDSTLSFVASLVPFTAPLVQPLRYGAQVISAWEVPVAMALCLATIAALVPMAARLYAGSALRFGGRVKLGEAWRGASGRADASAN